MPVSAPTYGADITEAWGDSVADSVNTLETEMDAVQAALAGAPRGVMGYAQSSVTQTGITTVTDLTSLTVTFTAVAGRRYKITGFLNVQSDAGATSLFVLVTDGSNNQLNMSQCYLGTSNQPMNITTMAVVSPSAGSVTYKLRLQRNTGSGNLSAVASSTQPNFILVEDIGLA